MAMAIFQGRDCIVAFQDRPNIGVYGNRLGTSALSIALPRSWPVPFEEVRDRVFKGKVVAFTDAPVEMPAGMMLVSRTYDPMIGRGGEVCGIVSEGLVKAGAYAAGRGGFGGYPRGYRARMLAISDRIIMRAASGGCIRRAALAAAKATSTTAATAPAASGP
jgi:hypothetical protein